MTLSERDSLIESALPLARRLASSFVSKSPRYRDRDDYIGEAYLALTEAAVTFDASRGVQFSTFAYRTIVGYLYHKLERDGGYFYGEQAVIRDTERTFERMAQADEREPSLSALSEAVPGYERCLKSALVRNPVSDADLIVHPADATAGPEEEVIARDFDERIVEAVEALPAGLRLVAKARFINGSTYERIQAEGDMSYVTVWRRMKRAGNLLASSLGLLEAA